MTLKRGIALAAACWGFAALTAGAQVSWVAPLNPPTAIAADLTDTFVASAGDGTLIATGFGSDGEAVRMRIAKIAVNGTEQWVRWAGAGASSTTVATMASVARPPLLHTDGSITVSYAQGSNTCLENYAANGDRRAQYCLTTTATTGLRIVRGLDDEILFAAGSAPRTIRKLSRTGTLLWSTQENLSPPTYLASSIDSAGNYVEVYGLSMIFWSPLTGQRLATATLPQSFRTTGASWNSPIVSRSGRDVVLFRDLTTPGGATNAAVGRFGSDGSLRWSINLSFAGSAAANDTVTLHSADNDGVYVVRASNVAGGNSEIVKLSASGAILWQRNYFRIHRVLVENNTLTAIRSDVGASDSHSYVFHPAAANGDLDNPVIYSRPNSATPSGWFAVNGGTMATFVAAANAQEAGIASKLTYVGDVTANRWVYVTSNPRSASAAQLNCLMPRLSRSSPDGWWGRTQAISGSVSPADWASVSPAGSTGARTAVSAPACGPVVGADGARVVVSVTPRAAKVDNSGATAWTTAGVITPTGDTGQPVQAFAANGDTLYQIGNLLGRVSATGTILFETVVGGDTPRFLAIDSADAAWSVTTPPAVATSVLVTRVSSAGTLLWSTSISAQACATFATAARLTAGNELLVMTQSCGGQATLYKLDATGALVWQRSVSTPSPRSMSRLRALSVDSVGNIYAGGCSANALDPASGSDAASLVVSWSAAGNERWQAGADLIGGARECVTGLAIDGSDNLFASTTVLSATESSRAPVLWSLSSAGGERWRHATALANPTAGATDLALDTDGTLLALGEALANAAGPRLATLRRIDVSSIGSSLVLKVLAAPTQFIGYRAQFPITVGLRTLADAPATRAVDTVVWLAQVAGTGTLDGGLSCTILAGASSCTIADTRYDRVESGVILSASADGFVAVNTPSLAFSPSDTVTTLTPLVAGPYQAYSVLRVRASVDLPPPPAGGSAPGSLSGPSASGLPAGANCVPLSSTVVPAPVECDFLLRSGVMPLSAQFSSFDTGKYLSSAAVPLTLPRTQMATIIQATPDPANTYIAGDRVRYRVSVLVATTGFNATPFVSSSLSTSVGSCAFPLQLGSLANGYAGSYSLCELTSAPLGAFQATFSFSGDADLLPATPINVAATINAGAVLRRSGTTFQAGTSVCTLSPGVSCQFTDNSNNTWQCVGPSGMSGQVFLVPPANGIRYVYPATPFAYNNVVGIDSGVNSVNAVYPSTACNLDVDGDGARMTMTDGLLILRRMLGLSGDALLAGATHACSPRTATSVASSVNLTALDIDGDGSTRADTDGLLLLRSMLGIRGDAMVQDAIGAGAARRTTADINSYLQSTCLFP